jgi:hypothetical protein
MKILTRHNIQRSKQQINMSKVFLNVLKVLLFIIVLT